MNKAFAFITIAILLASSIPPVVESEWHTKNNKTMEIPVKIYTLNGIKEIKKELPVNEAKEILLLSNETAEALKMLINKHATLKEKARANEIIDSFLYKMKEYGLLGNLSIKEAKELITGKYLQKERNRMNKMAMMANLLQNDGLEINIMAIFLTGSVVDIFPWNAFLWDILAYAPFFFPITEYLVIILLTLPDMIPHPTTIGFWIGGGPHKAEYFYTFGLLGEKEVVGDGTAITIGFTGFVIMHLMAIGFCPFVAMRGCYC